MAKTYDINSAETEENGRKANIFFFNLLIWLCLIVTLCVNPQNAQAAGIYTEPGTYQMSANWAYPVKCHTIAEKNGDTLLLYSSTAEDHTQTIMIDRISRDGRRKNVKKLSVPGETWGGTVYHAPDGCYYMTTGNDGQIAFYVMKYDADWNLLGTASVTKEQSYVQTAFHSGNSDMTMAGDYLIVHAARQRPDGHQSNTTIWINSKTMKPVYVPKENGDTHVSHSFSQFVRYDGNRIIMIDQGDAYPRGIRMTSQLPVLSGKDTKKTMLMDFWLNGIVEETTDMSVLNYTGTTVDGFELGSRHHLVVGTSIPHDTFTSGQEYADYKGCNNIYTILVDKDLNSSTLKWLTSYPSDIRVRNVELIKAADDRFLIVYGTGKETADGYTDTTHYMLVDSDGNVLRSGELAKPFYGTSEISFDGTVLTWCHTAESELGRFLALSRWNIDTGDFSVQNIETGTASQISSLFPIKDIRNQYETGEILKWELGVFSPLFEENLYPTAIAVWESSDSGVVEVLTNESALSKTVSSSSKYEQWYKTAESAFLAKGEGTATVTCKVGDKKWSAVVTVFPEEIEMTPTPYPIVVPSHVPTKSPVLFPSVPPAVTVPSAPPAITPFPVPTASLSPDASVQKPQISDDGITTWDCVYFGNYWQNDTNGDGAADQHDAKQPIKWRVLSVNGEDAFLMADKNLDARPYHETGEKVTWKTCTLRSWLNGAFLDQAFNAEEQAAVLRTTVENDDNSYYGTQGGGDTVDRVYLLSFDEATYPFYGFHAVRGVTETRESANTAYTKARGAFSIENGNGCWWLRTQGISNGRASCAGAYGDVDTIGELVDHEKNVVRPVLHLNLSLSSAWSPAGTVSSDGTVDELAPPFVPEPSPTEGPHPVPTETPSGPVADTSTEKPGEIEEPDGDRTPGPTEAPQSTPGQMPRQTPSQNVPPQNPPIPSLPVTNQPVADEEDEYDDDDFDEEEDDEDEYDEEWEKGDRFLAGNVKYKITKRKGKKGEVAVVGMKSKKTKSIVIPKKVKKGGITFAITSIQNNAFRGCKKARKLTIRSTDIRTMEKKALSGLDKRIRIQIPKGRAKKYRKWLSKCGYGSNIK